MNYKKIILVGCISAFVAFTTSIMGVAGTIIGSVISSVLYNMLSEALEKPVSEASFSSNFEWEIAYIFPLIIISLIQLLLILSFLSEWGLLPLTFLNFYLTIQDLANNNLYRILGLALLVMSVYPAIIKPAIVKRYHGRIVGLVGVIFLARGFVDLGNSVTELYNPIFELFDFPIAVIALLLLIFVIVNILKSARKTQNERKIIKRAAEDEINSAENAKSEDFPFKDDSRKTNQESKEIKPERFRHKTIRQKSSEQGERKANENQVKFKKQVTDNPSKLKINESSDKIQFESNDLLDEYK